MQHSPCDIPSALVDTYGTYICRIPLKDNLMISKYHPCLCLRRFFRFTSVVEKAVPNSTPNRPYKSPGLIKAWYRSGGKPPGLVGPGGARPNAWNSILLK